VEVRKANDMTINPASWINGLMALNREAIGFIPDTTVQQRYIALDRYVLQCDERGNPVGYLLHGALHPGGVLIISQHVIEDDKRLRGYGEAAFGTVLDRAQYAGCKQIRLHCAEELPANAFWVAMGFQCTRVLHPNNRRQRAVNVLLLDLWPTLLK
jgi:hypothetical protein